MPRTLVAAVALDRRRRTLRESGARCPRAARGDGPRPQRVDRGDAVDVVGAVGDRHLRELRPVERPVHLNQRDRPAHRRAPPQSSARRRTRSTARRADPGAAAAQTRAARRSPRCSVDGALDEVEREHRVPRDRPSPARRRGRRGATARTTSIAFSVSPSRSSGDFGDRLEPVGAQHCATAPPAPDDRCRPARSRSASEKPVSGRSPASARRSRTRARASSTESGGAHEAHLAGLARLDRRGRASDDRSTRPYVTRSPDRALRASSPSMPTLTRSGEASSAAGLGARQRRRRPRHALRDRRMKTSRNAIHGSP